jgi:predicted dehydrogenase
MALRVALLGCGRIAQLSHLKVLTADPDVQVVAMADPDKNARDWAAGVVPSAKVHADFRELLRDGGADAVIVALPTPLHKDAAVQALQSGLHLYLEKPIAATPADAREIIDAWRKTSLTAAIGFNCRSNALYRELKQAVEAREAGTPVAVRTALTACWPSAATWRLNPDNGGGALLELASHHVDLLRFIFGDEIATVSATTWSNGREDEAAMLQLRLSSGLVAQTLVSYGTAEEDRVEVYASSGKLVVDRYDSLVVERKPARSAGGIQSAVRRMREEIGGFAYGLEKRKSPGQEPSFGRSLSSFLDAVRARRSASPDLVDGYRALEVIDAARRSVAEGRVISLTQGSDGVR